MFSIQYLTLYAELEPKVRTLSSSFNARNSCVCASNFLL